jgi:hypothetical protein
LRNTYKRLDGDGMANKNWKPLTPTQEFHKAMRETDAWIKKEMIKHAPEIEENIRLIQESRNV